MRVRKLGGVAVTVGALILGAQGVAAAATGTISPHTQSHMSGDAASWVITWSGGTSATFDPDDANSFITAFNVISGHTYFHTFCDVTPHQHEGRLDVLGATGLSIFHTFAYAATTTDC
jgi:hypothetical protein